MGLGDFNLGGNIYTMDEWKNLGMGSKFFDNSVISSNGNPIKMDGWGSDAVGLLGAGINLYQNNKAMEQKQKNAEDILNFKKDAFYKNWAMNMAKYRDYLNNRSMQEASQRAGNEGRLLNAGERDKYLQNNVSYDANGNRMVDPSSTGVSGKTYYTGATPQQVNGGSGYNAVSAFAPTTTRLFVENSALMDPANTKAISALARTTPVPKKVTKSRKSSGLSNVKRPEPNQVKKPENQ